MKLDLNQTTFNKYLERILLALLFLALVISDIAVFAQPAGSVSP